MKDLLELSIKKGLIDDNKAKEPGEVLEGYSKKVYLSGFKGRARIAKWLYILGEIFKENGFSFGSDSKLGNK
tara:strand:+ start:731 stop:946 length:216 start_codon:yes stop_codon:yes gene_type:complete